MPILIVDTVLVLLMLVALARFWSFTREVERLWTKMPAPEGKLGRMARDAGIYCEREPALAERGRLTCFVVTIIIWAVIMGLCIPTDWYPHWAPRVAVWAVAIVTFVAMMLRVIVHNSKRMESSRSSTATK